MTKRNLEHYKEKKTITDVITIPKTSGLSKLLDIFDCLSRVCYRILR